MEKITGFCMSDRYFYDFRACKVSDGWAQFDSEQDASYFGNWVNPFRREWFSYAEGDTALVRCANDAEFVTYVRETFAWYAEREEKRPGVDPGFNKALKAEFVRLSLADLMYPTGELNNGKSA